jgi:5-oxopent-3-ene-1,2,5-tricarboxylate decarboxylase / 2-hydroxyhepta-2,4-diene-1,7-dioate isomerase
VYCSGRHPAVLGRRHVPWETDVTITCGGATVQPGDVIVGDDDGVIVIPPALVDQVLTDAELQEEEESFIAEMVARGESVRCLYPLDPHWRNEFDSWRARRSADGTKGTT